MSDLTILVADDNPTDRYLLAKLIEREGYHVLAVEDGAQAVAAFEKHQPDIVLLDALMPAIDGFATARRIRELNTKTFLPIVFVTGLESTTWLEKCLQAGGDDVLIKPFNPVLLRTKISGYQRLIHLQQNLDQQQAQLDEAQRYFDYEQEVARNMLNKVLNKGCLQRGDIRYKLSPLAVFNGDVLLAAERQNGQLCIFLGDFTGHGLAAGIGAMPLADTFYQLVYSGMPMAAILREINNKMKEILAVNVFCCAAAIEIDPQTGSLRIWNGGLPDLYLVRPGEGIVNRFPSANLALGILSERSFKVDLPETVMKPGDRLVGFTDGVLEAVDANNQFFGEQAVEFSLQQHSEGPFKALLGALEQHSSNELQQDDISLFEYCYQPAQSENQQASLLPAHQKCVEGEKSWNLHFDFRPPLLKQFSPIDVVYGQLKNMPELSQQGSEIYMIISELLNNALEHGLLGLDSSLKVSEVGFEDYYRAREQRLDALKEGSVQLDIECVSCEKQAALTIRVSDSGPGFDYQQPDQQQRRENRSGHGIYLLKNVCKDVRFLGAGNTVEVVYGFQRLH